jgi:hypothetical protein
MQTATAMTFNLYGSDVTRQKKVRLPDVSRDSTVRELVKGLVGRLRLVDTDQDGRPLQYRARLEREGRHLHDSEIVNDALQPDDEVVLHPKINAG